MTRTAAATLPSLMRPLWVLVVLASLGGALPAHAALRDTLHVRWGGAGTVLFGASSVAPGQTVWRTVRVRNAAAVPQDLFLRVRNVRGALARHVRFVVRDARTGRSVLGGRGERLTLSRAGRAGALFLARVPAHATVRYRIALRLDPAVGNDVQGARTRFDLRLTFSGEPVRDGRAAPLRPGRRRDAGDAPAVLGAETAPQPTAATTVVLGADGTARTCRTDARAVWLWRSGVVLVALGLFAQVVAQLLTRRAGRARWLALALLTAVFVAVWLVRDVCSDAPWVGPTVALLWLAALGVARFLHRWRRRD